MLKYRKRLNNEPHFLYACCFLCLKYMHEKRVVHYSSVYNISFKKNIEFKPLKSLKLSNTIKIEIILLRVDTRIIFHLSPRLLKISFDYF